jgi:hypothetical protein
MSSIVIGARKTGHSSQKISDRHLASGTHGPFHFFAHRQNSTGADGTGSIVVAFVSSSCRACWTLILWYTCVRQLLEESVEL